MPAWLISRLFRIFWLVPAIATLVFLLMHWIPGDTVTAMLGESASAADAEALRHALGLDRPLRAQWLDYMAALARFDLGHSLYDGQAVSALLAARFGATAELGGWALACALVLALPLGMLAAARRGTAWDRAAMSFSLLGMSVPNFWLGPLLVLVFSLGLGWFPVSGRAAPLSVALPALTLGTGLAAVLARMLRGSLLEVLGEDYIRSALARGLHPRRVLLRHALRNAALPMLTVLGMQLGALLGGAVVTEVVFAWPGLGTLMVESIQRRDYPVVQGCVLLISLSYVLVNLLTDLAYVRADPRIRLGEGA